MGVFALLSMKISKFTNAVTKLSKQTKEYYNKLMIYDS